MSLKVIALSPPEFQEDFLPTGDRMSSVNSRNPYSLLATLTKTFSLIRANILDVLDWDTPEGIRNHVFLMRHWWEEKNILKEKLTRQSPDIIFLGTFAMNFPWAIEVAKMVRELCPETLIVLGGRHIGETFWSDVSGDVFGPIREHPEANPLQLMASGQIPPVFDLIISHDGQDLIPEIISLVESAKKLWKKPRDIVFDLSQFQDTPGYWTMGKVQEGTIQYQQPNKYRPGDVSQNRSPYIYYGSDGVHFPVFSQTNWTAHVHSDSQWVSGNTCTMDCSFCSEARGKVPFKKSHEVEAGDRLFDRFLDIMEVAERDMRIPSIFVEDSILCWGHWWAMERFCECMEHSRAEWVALPVEWWCQFTVPMITLPRGQKIISRLQACWLNYIYFGLESAKPSIAKDISKTGGREGWSSLSEKAVAYLSSQGINVGTSNIFAMGESHEDRMNQLRLIRSWQQKYQWNPVVYSLNLQTVHPWEWSEGYSGEKSSYAAWWLDPADLRSPLLQELFWEAAVKYLRHPSELPTYEELSEIQEFLKTMNNTTLNWTRFSHALWLNKKPLVPEVRENMQKNPEELLYLSKTTAQDLLRVPSTGKIFFPSGITLWLAQIFHAMFDWESRDIVFSDHELKHVREAVGIGIVSNHDTTWSSFGPIKSFPKYPGRILRQHEVAAPSYLVQTFEPGTDESVWQDMIRTKCENGEIVTFADVFYLSRVSRLTGETLLTPQLYKQLKRQYPWCTVICDGAQSLWASLEDVSEYCDVYLWLSSKFVGASPHLGVAWISPDMLRDYPRMTQLQDVPPSEFRREYAEFITYGNKASQQDIHKTRALQKRVQHLFQDAGLVPVAGDHLMTFRMAPEHYFPSKKFFHYCLDMLPFLSSRGIDIGLNLAHYSIGYIPWKNNDYLRVSVSHETTQEDVDILEKALIEFRTKYCSHI